MNRLHQLSAVLDERLHQFAGAIDLREEGYGGCMDMPSAPYFPKLYLSGKKDKALMSMPGEGTALINYKVQRRNIDETRADGPRYGADIEIRSIEPVAEEAADDEAGEGAELSSTLFLHQFGSGGLLKQARGYESVSKKLMKLPHGVDESLVEPLLYKRAQLGSRMIGRQEISSQRTMKQLMKTRGPVVIKRKVDTGEFLVKPRKAPLEGDKTYYTNDIKDARGTAADILRRERKNPGTQLSGTFFLHQFAGTRDRDSEGRFDSGTVAKPDDYALAMAPKKSGIVKPLAIGAGAGLLTGTQRGRGLTQAAYNAMKKAAGKALA